MSDPARPLGFWTATALVVGGMIGAGIYQLPAQLAPYGAASLLGWALSITGVSALAIVFAHLARRFPRRCLRGRRACPRATVE